MNNFENTLNLFEKKNMPSELRRDTFKVHAHQGPDKKWGLIQTNAQGQKFMTHKFKSEDAARKKVEELSRKLK